MFFHLALGANGCAAKRASTCTFWRDGDGPAGTLPVRAEIVASGLDTPWSVAFVSPDAMLVTERPGRLRLVTNGVVVPEPVATLPAVEHEGEETGLLGLALSPSFAETRRLFVYYSFQKPGGPVNRIERWILAPDARSARFDRLIVDDIPGSTGHDGGRLRFGPDHMLYAGTGDAHDRGLPPVAENDAGKVLRMDEDGNAPPDNPWAGRRAWVKGLRNVEGFDWLDPKDPNSPIVIAMHGPSGELGRQGNDKVIVATKGADAGWPDTWQDCDVRDGVTPAAITWEKAVPPGGAAFYTGARIPEWRGSLIVGVLGAKHVHRVVFDRGDPRRVTFHETYFSGDPPAGLGRVRDVVMSPDGELYVTTSNCDGRGTCPADGDKIVRITR